MKRDPCFVDSPPGLRERAEAAVREGVPDIGKMSPEEIRDLIHDLRVSRAERDLQIETLRKNCEMQARRSDEALSLLENSPDVIVRFDRELRIRYFNPAFKEVTGFPEEQAAGHTPSELEIPQDLASAVETKARFVFDTVQETTLEFEYTGTEGKRYYHARFVPERYEGDMLTTILATAHDVTDLIEAREELRESEERFRSVSELISDYAYSFRVTPDSRLDVEWVYGPFEQITGYTPEEANISGDWIRITYPDDLEENLRRIRTLLEGNEARTRLRYVSRSGDVRWMQDNARPIKDDQGRVVRIIGAAADISDLKLAEEFRSLEKEYRTLAENSPDIILRLDRNLRYLYVNSETERVTGIPRERFIGKNDREIGMPEEVAAFWDQVFNEVLETGKGKIIEYDIPGPEGTRYFQSRIVPETGRDGKIETILSVTRDITALKRAEEELRKAKDELEEEVWRRTVDMERTIESLRREIAERERVQAAIRENEMLLSTVLDTLPVGVMVLDREGKIIRINPASQHIWGKTKYDEPDEFRMFKGWRTTTGEFIQDDQWAAARALRTGGIFLDEEIEIEDSEGKLKIILNSAAPLRDENGNIYGAIMVNEDITDRKMAELELRDYREHLEQLVLERTAELEDSNLRLKNEIEERKQVEKTLRESEEKFRIVLKNAPINMIMQDRNRCHIWLYDAQSRVTPEDIYGKKEEDLFPPEEAARLIEIKERVMETGTGERVEMPLTFLGRETVFLDITIEPMRDNEGKVVGVVSVNLNITERKRVEEALSQSEDRYRKLFEANLAGNYLVRFDGTILDFNEAMMKMLGYESREELFRHNAADFYVDPEYRQELIRILERDGIVPGREALLKRKDGSIWNALGYAVVLAEERTGEPYIQGVAIDITERKRAEEALRESEERYRKLFETSLAGNYITKTDGTILDFNDAMMKMLGYGSREEVFQHNSLDFYADPEYRKELVRLVQRDGVVPSKEALLKRKDGSLLYALGYAVVLTDERTGEPYIQGVAIDITERKKAEEALRESEARFRVAMDNFPGVFLVYDSGHRIQWVNRIGIEKSGHTREEIIGHLDEEVYPESVLNAYRPSLLKAVETKEPQTLEAHLTPDGEYWVLMNIVPLLDDRRNIWQILIISYDITLRKKAEERTKEYAVRLRRQAAQLIASNKELEAFSYSISHDLRAPLRSIDGFSLALAEDYSDQLDEQARDYISRIRAAAQRMAQLIEDLLNLSRTTRAELNYAAVNLSAQAQSVVEELRQAEPERKVETVIQEGMTVEGDEALLRQALVNLLGNSWKFTSHQEVARIEFGEKREEGRRIFFVRDNGAGFDMQHAENLFVPFRRLHSEQEFPGTGIGLSIVRRIIQRHGGDIWAESEVGKGATFYFTLGE